jgi:hypothetical protein
VRLKVKIADLLFDNVVVGVVVGTVVEIELKVKTELELAVPPGVVTLITPLPPLPTVAVIWVAEFTMKFWADVLPKVTAAAPIRFMPVITTEVPLPPEVGEKEVMVGSGVDVVDAGVVVDVDVDVDVGIDLKVKLWVELPVPFGVVMLITPLDPLPAMAVI